MLLDRYEHPDTPNIKYNRNSSSSFGDETLTDIRHLSIMRLFHSLRTNNAFFTLRS